ncbi:MAG: prolyl oligopeptidase family serine peptidase [Acidobacteriota bacterium]
MLKRAKTAGVLPALVAAAGVQAQVERGFVPKELELDGITYRYQVFVPESWSPLQEWPVILFLHGAGERGTDGVRQTEVGLGPAIRRNPGAFPALVVMPQCRRGVWWSEPAMEALVMEALDRTVREYRGDPDRVYLTGLSMGGYGTFHFAARYPQRFAALAPVCGGAVPPQRLREGGPAPGEDPYRELAERIRGIPVWIFHGDQDRTVPVSESRKMYKALQEAGAAVKYTEYSGVGHNSWDRAYSEPALVTWLLEKRKR